MITSNEPEQEQTQHHCFLCSLDQQPCSVPSLEGLIVRVHEAKLDGESTPFITIEQGNDFASFSLTHHYRSLVKELKALGDDNLRAKKLILRVFHLPAPSSTVDRNGRTVYRYRANDYTLAILEPDTILNITDLKDAEYCARQYMLRRLASSPQSAASMRGNLVHYSFKELLKEHDRGEFMTGYAANGEETPQVTLRRHFERELERKAFDLALMNTSVEEIREESLSHLESLASWFQNQRTTLWDMPATASSEDNDDEQAEKHRSQNMVRAETFLLAPEIGLRGRLDLLWRQTGRQRLLELKTGKATGELPISSHKWQVQGYHALLAVRRDPKMKKALALLLYSGTPGEAQTRDIRFTITQMQRVIEKRNLLVFSHITGIPPAPPGASRCTKCAMLSECEQISSLLDWKKPESELPKNDDDGTQSFATNGFHHLSDDEGERDQDSASALHTIPQTASVPNPAPIPTVEFPASNSSCNQANGDHSSATRGRNAWPPSVITLQDREFFATYYKLMQLEGLEGEKEQALLWKMRVKDRVEQGTAISELRPIGQPVATGQGEWQQTFTCTNTSELRVGDEILLSDGNPITGEVVTGSILDISSDKVTVWSPELISHPTMIDRYDINSVHVRTLQNLLRWLKVDPHLRSLASGSTRPQFETTLQVAPRPDFNLEQNLAVVRAMQMRDYLLIHGPPGTGKTSVIAEIVKRFSMQGQRVMLAAFTNQAVDNMLKRLSAEGILGFMRLGSARNVDSAIEERLMKKLVGHHLKSEDALVSVQDLLSNIPIVASTTATWSSDKYHSPSSDSIEDADKSTLFQFDVAIIDEAGQLTVPAILGALRFAKRFILVGDEKQLPPLVLSKKAADAGLSQSLFSILKSIDNDYTQDNVESESACVSLKVQYRMNRWISHFASTVFYDGQLRPHFSVANRMLDIIEPEHLPRDEKTCIIQAIDPMAPIIFLDVRGNQERAKTSDAEALAVRHVVSGLLARGVAEHEIGIIAPYRAQVANLRRHLFSDDETIGWKALAEDTRLNIDTVDRFQGGERPVIIMSFATNTKPEVDSQLRDHLTNPHRLNVALSRAQKKLILVGNAMALEGLPVFERLLVYCRGLDASIPMD
ncbi:MAG TPA: AAA domain-containing protein [Ktedonobacteraceae bacterium]|nr:AAA domain-containing protein [Ktedonobacteraceae bacterium]